jgi:hypothetical protein
MAKEPVWKGDPLHCDLCRNSVFPHSHADTADEPAPKARKKAAKPRKDASKAQVVATITAGRRGRPMSPENWELLRLCTCE